jgi:hypothetical protein
MLVKIFDPKLNIERTIPEKAYKILQKRYQFISYVDEEGNAIDGEPQVVQKKSVEKSAAPAEAKPRIVIAPQLKSPEEIEAKKAELQALNQEAIQKAEEEQAEKAEIKERKKPGPKPKANAKV